MIPVSITLRNFLSYGEDAPTLDFSDFQIANASDFSEVGFIPETLPEGVTVDVEGNVYVGEVIPRNLKKFGKTLGPPRTVPQE